MADHTQALKRLKEFRDTVLLFSGYREDSDIRLLLDKYREHTGLPADSVEVKFLIPQNMCIGEYAKSSQEVKASDKNFKLSVDDQFIEEFRCKLSLT